MQRYSSVSVDNRLLPEGLGNVGTLVDVNEATLN